MAHSRGLATAPDNPVHWHWPLKVALLSSRRGSVKQIFHGFWSGRLSVFEEISLHPGKPFQTDVLIIEGLKNANLFLNNRQLMQLVKPSVIIVRENEYNRSLTTARAVKQLKQFQKFSGAAGLYLIRSSKSLSDWYEGFIVHLSHNLSVGEAINQKPSSIYLSLESRNLAESTKLEHYIVRLSDSLKFSGRKKTLPGALRHIWTSQKINTPVALGRYLRENVKTLDYTMESETASKVTRTVEHMKRAGMKVPTIPASTISTREPSRGLPLTKKKGAKKAVRKAAPKKAAPKKAAAKKLAKKAIPKKKAAKGVKTTTRKPAPIQPRYLQVKFQKRGSKKGSPSFLEPSTAYQLKVRIGEEDKELLRATGSVSLTEIFRDPGIKSVKIDLEIRTNLSAKPLRSTIRLPREGSSNFCNFLINTGRKQLLFRAEIYAFHKERLLQKSVVSIDIRKETDKPRLEKPLFKTEAVLRKSLDNLDERQEFSASIVIPAKPSDTQTIVGRANQKPIGLRFSSSMAAFVKKFKEAIEQIALTDGNKSLTHPENVELLRDLANQGSRLHELYLNKLKLNGPLQLVNNMQDYLPLDFAYTLLPPEPGATLCKHAQQALNAGACKGCISNEEMQRTNICPFGFWGLSHIIERHQYPPQEASAASDYELRFEPTTGARKGVLKVLDRTLHASTDRVNGVVAGVSKKVAQAIGLHCKKPKHASTWAQWKSFVPTSNPESLLLLVHVEPGQGARVDALEIGKVGKSLLEQTQFDERYINTEKKGVTPFVILIGCETSNTDAYMFDTVTQLLKKGAAIVLSNFTEIRGAHAGEIIMSLVEILKKEAASETTFGAIVLKLRQQMLARGLLVSLTLLAHGDADWKIKT